MENIFTALVFLLALSACKSSNAVLPDRYYLVDNTTVNFTQDNTGRY